MFCETSAPGPVLAARRELVANAPGAASDFEDAMIGRDAQTRSDVAGGVLAGSIPFGLVCVAGHRQAGVVQAAGRLGPTPSHMPSAAAPAAGVPAGAASSEAASRCFPGRLPVVPSRAARGIGRPPSGSSLHGAGERSRAWPHVGPRRVRAPFPDLGAADVRRNDRHVTRDLRPADDLEAVHERLPG